MAATYRCIFAVFFLFCVIPSLADIATTRAYNRFIDDILRHRFQEESSLLGFDPYLLNNITYEFKDQSKVTLRLDFWDGQMAGLSRVRRDGDCNVYVALSGEEVSAHCTFLFENVTAEYTGLFTRSLHSSITFKAKAILPNNFLVATISQTLIPRLPPEMYSVGSIKEAGIFTSEVDTMQFSSVLQDQFHMAISWHLKFFVLDSFRAALQASLPQDLPPASN